MNKDNARQEPNPPSFQELDEALYSTLVRKMEAQHTTIKMLQLKQRAGAEWQNSLEEKDRQLTEKDRIIASLEQKVAEGNDASALKSQIEELEAENIELEKLLREKNERIRTIEKQYNEHLNRLNDQISEGSRPKADNTQVDSLTRELKAARQQIEILRSRKSPSDTLEQQIASLQSQLVDRESALTKIREQLGHEERLLIENETLRNQVELLQADLQKLNRQIAENRVPVASPELSLESLNLLIKLWHKLTQLSQNGEVLKECRDCLALLEPLLADAGLTPFESVGDPFDASRHHLIETVSSTELKHNSVFREICRGFMGPDGVFRKADVIVCRNPQICRSCGAENRKDSKFCFQCGSRLHLEMIAEDKTSSLRQVDDRENSQAYIELGESYLNRKELQLAADAFFKASVLNPSAIAARYGIIRVEEARGNYDNCREEIAKLAEILGTQDLVKTLVNRIEQKMRILESLQNII